MATGSSCRSRHSSGKDDILIHGSRLGEAIRATVGVALVTDSVKVKELGLRVKFGSLLVTVATIVSAGTSRDEVVQVACWLLSRF